MKLLPILLACQLLCASGGESYFFEYAKSPRAGEKRIEDGNLHIVIPIRKVVTPVASEILAFHQGLGLRREYQIQVNLKPSPEVVKLPMVVLDDEVITEGIHGSQDGDSKPLLTYSLESDDPEKIRRWCRLLGALLKLPEDRIDIDLTPAKPEDREHAPAKPEAKPEGNRKPQPETEKKRSR